MTLTTITTGVEDALAIFHGLLLGRSELAALNLMHIYTGGHGQGQLQSEVRVYLRALARGEMVPEANPELFSCGFMLIMFLFTADFYCN